MKTFLVNVLCVLLLVAGVATAQTQLSDFITPAPNLNLLITNALAQQAAPVTSFPASPTDGQCVTRSDLNRERFCYDLPNTRWLGELLTLTFTETGNLTDNNGGEYMRHFNNPMDVNEGFRAPFDVVFLGWSAWHDDDVSPDTDVDFLIDQVATPVSVTFSGNGAPLGVHQPFTPISLPLNAGQQLNARHDGNGDDIGDPVIYLQYRRVAN